MSTRRPKCSLPHFLISAYFNYLRNECVLCICNVGVFEHFINNNEYVHLGLKISKAIIEKSEK